MPAATQTRPLFEQIDTWLNEATEIKTAAAKKQPVSKNGTVLQKQAFGDPGMGETSHPSEKVDNDTHNAPEGARYRENSEDVKKDIPASVDSTPDAKAPAAEGTPEEDKQMPNIGAQQASTGEEPSVETGSVKGKKDDDGYQKKTTHPANAEDTGTKYSSYALKDLLKVAADKSNMLLAHLGNGHFSDNPRVQAAVKAAQAASTAVAPTAKATAEKVAAETAKAAAEQASVEVYIAEQIKQAEFDADLVGPFALSYLQKYAEPSGDESAEGEDHEEPAGGPAAGAPGDPAAAMAGGPPGAGGPAAMGGDPAAAAMGGGDAMGGGAPGGPGAGGPGGGGDVMGALSQGADQMGGQGQVNPQEALMLFAKALEDMGIDPSQLATMAQQGGSGAGPEGPAKMATVTKYANAVINFKRSGNYERRELKTANERKHYNVLKSYVKELCGLE
jgi:hypothetical protein